MRTQCSTYFVDNAHLDEFIGMLDDLRIALVVGREGSNGDPMPYILMLDELRLSLMAAKKAGHGVRRRAGSAC
jgi:hypothetical protein